jgi:hypothetical protein
MENASYCSPLRRVEYKRIVTVQIIFKYFNLLLNGLGSQCSGKSVHIHVEFCKKKTLNKLFPWLCYFHIYNHKHFHKFAGICIFQIFMVKFANRYSLKKIKLKKFHK